MRRSVEDERWRQGAADRKLWKERTEIAARQYLTDPLPCTAGNKEEEPMKVLFCDSEMY